MEDEWMMKKSEMTNLSLFFLFSAAIQAQLALFSHVITVTMFLIIEKENNKKKRKRETSLSICPLTSAPRRTPFIPISHPPSTAFSLTLCNHG